MASFGGKINSVVPDYKKTVVFLEGWWLVKAKEDVEGKRLSVAGFTSRGTKQAARVFSSAPILKVYDIFNLETTDGIIVKLGGGINMDRTKENGFSSEVFCHFIFGFPPYWEEFAENCFEGGCGNSVVSRIASMRGSSNGASQNHEGLSKVSHTDRDEKNMGVEDLDDTLLDNGQHSSAGTESSVDIPKVCSSQDQSINIIEGEEILVDFGSNVDLEGSVERFSSTSKCTSPVSNSVDNMKNVFFENPSILMNSTVDTINSFSKSVQLEDLIHHASDHQEENHASNCKENLNNNASNSSVELGEKMGIPKELARHPNARVLRSRRTYLKGTPKDDQTTVSMLEDERSKLKSVSVGGSDPSDAGPQDRMDTDGSEQSANPNMDQNCCVEREILVDFSSNVDLEGSVERVSSPSKCTSPVRNSVDNMKNAFFENPSVLMNSTVDTTNSFSKSVQPEDLIRHASDHHEENHASNCKENLNSYSSNSSVEPGKKMGISKELARHPIARVLRSRRTYLKGRQKDDQTTVSMLEDERSKLKSVSVGGSDPSDAGPQVCMATDGSVQSANPRMDQHCGDFMVQAGIQKNKIEEDKNCLKGAVGEKESISKKASKTRKKTKIKFNNATPVTRRRGKERAFIVSPESLSSKRSRSGRLLLPSLEFWRNQTAVYDADRQITGIELDRHAVQPYRGCTSQQISKSRKPMR